MAHPGPTKAFLQQSLEAAMYHYFVPFGCTHPTPPVCSCRTYLQIMLHVLTSQAQNLPTPIEVISG